VQAVTFFHNTESAYIFKWIHNGLCFGQRNPERIIAVAIEHIAIRIGNLAGTTDGIEGIVGRYICRVCSA
jgi:hypothetical protein